LGERRARTRNAQLDTPYRRELPAFVVKRREGGAYGYFFTAGAAKERSTMSLTSVETP
jgi:hypothetical protein